MKGKALWKQRRKLWDALDWRLTDRELGKQMRVSRERARQMRRDLGKPDSTLWPPQIRSNKVLERAKKLLPELRGKRVIEAEKVLGILLRNHGSVRQFLDQKDALKRWRPTHPWHLMNFRLPNVSLSRIWRISPAVISLYRTRHRVRPPKWNGNVFNCRSAKVNARDYVEAAHAEHEKARKFIS